MIRSLLLIKASLFSVLFSFAQQNNLLINSGEELLTAEKFFENQEYKKAIEHYSKIGSSDTNYIAALYELARTCSADSQYAKGLEYCQLGIAHHAERDRLPDFLTLEGVLYDNMNQPEKALKLFDSALLRYPAHTNLYVNKGNTLFHQKKYNEAAEVFKKGLLISPYSSILHFNLGVSELRLGNPVCSFLALTSCLLMNPSGNYAGSSVRLLNNISLATDDVTADVNNREYDIPEAYVLIEQIVLSKISHESSYKPIIKLDDKISRQMQVIFEKLEYDSNEKDFFMQYYVPYYKKVFADKKFEVLVNYAFSGVDVEEIKKYNNDHKKEIKKFETDLQEYFDLIRKTRELDVQKRDINKPGYYFGSSGQLVSKGTIINNKYIGDCIFYFPSGNIKSEGRLTEKEEKTGVWKYYFPNGALNAIEHYENGKQEGEEIYYYDNGNVSYTAAYKNNNLEGKKTAYYSEGNLKFIETYKDGKLNGEYVEYYSSGVKKSYANYINNKSEGQFVVYSVNGQKEKSGSYINGLLSGPYAVYYPDGSLSLEAVYEKDQISGTQKTYYKNGKLKSIANYVQGKLNGEYLEYYDNGQLYYKCIYVDGVFNGDVNFVDDDGIFFCVITYDKDIPVATKYFDKKGKQVSASIREKGNFYWAAHSPDGFKNSETLYDAKGLKNGTQKYFFKNGKLNGTEEFRDNMSHGKSIGYHPNGQLYFTSEFEDGKRTGYYTEYSISGVKLKEGGYVDDQQQGKWLYYDERGNLTNEANVWNGMAHGIQKEYWPNGKQRSESNFINDRLQQLVQFDTLGKEYNRVTLVNGNGKYVLLHLNGKPKVESFYKNGNIEGKFSTYYFDGSLESEQYYKGGLMDSIYRAYTYGGNLRVEGRYTMNQKTGIWKFYRGNGKLSSVEKYKNDEVVDTIYYYHENGKPSYLAQYKNGVKEGHTQKYAEDGSLVYQVNYKDGDVRSYSYHDANLKLVPEILIPGDFATVKTYYPDGKLSAEFSYENRKLKGFDNEYYTNGKIFIQSTENYSNTEGEYKQYYPSGKLKYDNSYKDNNIHGPSKEFYESGILKASYFYYNGTLHGMAIKYDEKGKLIETQYYYYGELLSVKK